MTFITFRPYETHDQAALSATIDAVCGECPHMVTRRFEADSLWLEALSNPGQSGQRLWLAVDGEQVVGWCRVFAEAGLPANAQADLGIGLLESYRSRRLGTELIHTALEDASASGLELIHLQVKIGNSIARRLFQSSGFRTFGQQGMLVTMIRASQG